MTWYGAGHPEWDAARASPCSALRAWSGSAWVAVAKALAWSLGARGGRVGGDLQAMRGFQCHQGCVRGPTAQKKIGPRADLVAEARYELAGRGALPPNPRSKGSQEGSQTAR